MMTADSVIVELEKRVSGVNLELARLATGNCFAKIEMPNAMRNVTISARVTGVKRTRARIWLGTKIMMIAALVMGCNVDLEVK